MTALRFAMRPGGPLTLAAVREAIINWLFARRQNARFLLRIGALLPLIGRKRVHARLTGDPA